MALNQYPEALRSYIRATQRNPRFGDAYNNLGNCQLALHHNSAAAASYRAAVRSAPQEANYYCNLGSLIARFLAFRFVQLAAHSRMSA
jgi:tetratricopeptide (TPR) repeat protein